MILIHRTLRASRSAPLGMGLQLKVVKGCPRLRAFADVRWSFEGEGGVCSARVHAMDFVNPEVGPLHDSRSA